MRTSESRAALPGLWVLLAFSSVACASSGAAKQTALAGRAQGCPSASVPALRATMAYESDGVAISFAARPDDSERVRGAVRAMARAGHERGNPFAGCACQVASYGATQPMAGEAPPTTVTPASFPETDIRVTNTPDGATLALSLKHEAGKVVTEADNDYQAYDLQVLRRAAFEQVLCINQGTISSAPRR